MLTVTTSGEQCTGGLGQGNKATNKNKNKWHKDWKGKKITPLLFINEMIQNIEIQMNLQAVGIVLKID